ncbi:hypothetical protein JOF56_009684 [Kibdelosporangium banguiense]|uniref:Secreted protein n=1 Tax=Kibdelosporangium banguiense TaxID=1365924 RepID=A0ABS4TY42_9PSEU|nr:hypothetical protein [Kibdelosporangium banguiense]MBP2329299.1 hypothetical protein [Kibdelosporangium banguiense]
MLRRLTQLFVTTALVATGTLVLTASPAAAAGGCTPPPQNGTIGACIDYSGGSYAQADFYLNVNPDWSRYQYTVVMYQNGVPYTLTDGMPDFTSTGRYCCWYKHVAALPQRWITLRTRVNVYMQNGAFHYAIDSPTISVRA